MSKPKLLVIDIETKPTLAYVWRAWDENISPDQIVEDGGLLCFSAKFVGDKTTFFFSEWNDGQSTMVREAHKLLSEADAVITYNGDKFDLPKLMGEFVLEGLNPPPPWTSIDLIKPVKKLGFLMNRLAYIGPLLQIGDKIKHEGFALWSKVLDGDEKAKKKMEKYCKEDTLLTEKLYKKIKPFIRNHPHLGAIKSEECGSCGSRHLHSRGTRRTKSFAIQRLQCQDCGSWSDGKRTKV